MNSESNDNIFKFQIDFDTKKVLCEPLGRLYLADGSCVRIVFSPRGLLMSVDKRAIDNKSLIIINYEDEVQFAGLGRMPEKPEGGILKGEDTV